MISLKSLLGCFLLLSLTIAQAGTPSFSVSSKQAYAPATLTFDASGINQAKKYLWTFGDGGTLTTTNSIVSYQYKNAGNFTASLSYQVNASDKNPNYKDAGSVAITILAKQQQNFPPTAALSCSINNLLANCNALGSTDPQGKPLSCFIFFWVKL
jgi:PKD repeat protein